MLLMLKEARMKTRDLPFAPKAIVAVSALLVSALAVSVPASTSLVGAAPICRTWGGAQPPNVGTLDNTLLGVAVVSSCNAWAVGRYLDGANNETLIEHWNGSAWKI
jgi:hypothetical protein